MVGINCYNKQRSILIPTSCYVTHYQKVYCVICIFYDSNRGSFLE